MVEIGSQQVFTAACGTRIFTRRTDGGFKVLCESSIDGFVGKC